MKSKIKKITKLGPKSTIDIEVSGNRLFYGNGILTHNSGYNNSDIDLSNTSESFGLPATSDFFLAIMQTEELAKQGQYLCKQLKNRYRDMNDRPRFMLGVDKPTMKLFEVDSAQAVLKQTEREFVSENDERTFDDFDV